MTSPLEPPPEGGADVTELTDEERKSLTHGDFYIPEGEREVFAEALRALNGEGIAYVVSGLYALHQYTGIYRKTKDLDLLFEPTSVIDAARALRKAGFRTRLESAHWLGKAFKNDAMVDLVYGMANGLHLIDKGWYRNSRPGKLAGVSVRVAPAEELVMHRLFISERHRSDSADIAHLFMIRGSELDWTRLIQRVGEHWRLLLAQLHFFDFCYPGRRREVPVWVRETLDRRALDERDIESADADICQGTLLSRFSYAIDVNEWGMRDYRQEAIAATRTLPIIEEIRESPVWDSVNHEPDFQVPGQGDGPARVPVINGGGEAAGERVERAAS